MKIVILQASSKNDISKVCRKEYEVCILFNTFEQGMLSGLKSSFKNLKYINLHKLFYFKENRVYTKNVI